MELNHEFTKLCRRAAAQGAVLLKNENKILPFTSQDRIAIFGRCQIEYYRSGTGSGGAVNVAYTTNLLDGLRNSNTVSVNETLAQCYTDWLKEHPFDNGGGGWACEPWNQQEMLITHEIAAEAARESDKALIVVGRTAGEDKDNAVREGSYLLTETEKEMIRQVCSAFDKVVLVLNVSNIIDMSFFQEEVCHTIKAIVYAWQGGMEGGNGIADVLTGKETFQGKLTDTIASDISCYPSDRNFGGDIKNVYQEDIYVGYRYFETFARQEVLYPFGYGLSYTQFELSDCSIEVKGSEADMVLDFHASVTNVGNEYSGREIVQLYVEAVNSSLGRPCRELIGFCKTEQLECGERSRVEISVPIERIAAYDDCGVTGHRNAYVVEQGEYRFYAGSNVRETEQIRVNGGQSYYAPATIVVRDCEEALAPSEAFERMHAVRCGEKVELTYEKTPIRTISLEKRIADNMPIEYAYTGDQGLKLEDVVNHNCTMEQFTAQLSRQDLAAIVRGEGMCSIKVTPGTAAAFGGVSDNLSGFGIPIGCCADGPSGIRMDNGSYATQVPIGTLLACTWDEALTEELFMMLGSEMRENNIDTLLGPGMNIHRHPLNGRNFEYFSEDPLVTGKIAACVVRGLAHNHVYATIKHFACNSQETGRHVVNAVVSQRALREIYLKGFEIAVREGKVRSVMTAYNPINGYWTASNYDLTTTILRKEWGYTGIVMTDWWAQMNDVVKGGEGSRQRTADMVIAQNDIYMVVNNNGAEINAYGDDTIQALETGRLNVAQLQRNAMNICRFLMDTPAFERRKDMKIEIPFIPANSQEDSVDELGGDHCLRWGEHTYENKHFQIKKDGSYDVIVKMMCPYSDRAQTVCKAKLNGTDMITFQTNGTDGRWIMQKLLRVRLEQGAYSLELEFTKPGMEIEYMEFKLCEEQEGVELC